MSERMSELYSVQLEGHQTVQETYVSHIGKEANKLEEVHAGFVHNAEEVYINYGVRLHDHWEAVIVPILKKMPARASLPLWDCLIEA